MCHVSGTRDQLAFKAARTDVAKPVEALAPVHASRRTGRRTEFSPGDGALTLDGRCYRSIARPTVLRVEPPDRTTRMASLRGDTLVLGGWKSGLPHPRAARQALRVLRHGRELPIHIAFPQPLHDAPVPFSRVTARDLRARKPH